MAADAATDKPVRPAPRAYRAPDTLGFLLGEWSLERRITDHLTDQDLVFDGTAQVTPDTADPETAIYREEGLLEVHGRSGPARRSLRFARIAPAGVAVAFADGRPFFDLDLTTGICTATHPCKADTYLLSFDVLDADTMLEGWNVRGPDKDYDAETVWRRRE